MNFEFEGIIYLKSSRERLLDSVQNTAIALFVFQIPIWYKREHSSGLSGLSLPSSLLEFDSWSRLLLMFWCTKITSLKCPIVLMWWQKPRGILQTRFSGINRLPEERNFPVAFLTFEDFCFISPVERNIIWLQVQHSKQSWIQFMSDLQKSDSLLLFESLQKKSGPRAKVQQPGTSDQSTRKRTASIKSFFRPPRAFGAPFESFTALPCFCNVSQILSRFWSSERREGKSVILFICRPSEFPSVCVALFMAQQSWLRAAKDSVLSAGGKSPQLKGRNKAWWRQEAWESLLCVYLLLSCLTSPADVSESCTCWGLEQLCWNGAISSCSLSSCIFPPPLLVMSLCLEGTAVLVGLGVSATLFYGRLLPAAHVALRCNCAAASGKSWRSAAAGSPWGCWPPRSPPGGHCCCCWCSSWLESVHAVPPVGWSCGAVARRRPRCPSWWGSAAGSGGVSQRHCFLRVSLESPAAAAALRRRKRTKRGWRWRRWGCWMMRRRRRRRRMRWSFE